MTCSQPLSEEQARSYLSQGLEGDIKSLARLDDFKRLQECVAFVALWLIGAWLVLDTPWVSSGILLLACAYNAGVLLVHEAMHGLLLRSRALNLWLGRLLSLTFFCSFTAYRLLHTRHHRHLGGPGDPDDYYNYTASPGLVWLLQYWRLCLGSFCYLPLMPIVAWREARPQERRWIAQELLLMPWLYGWLASQVPLEILLTLWLLPVLLVGCFTNLRGFVQHGLCDRGDSLLASRSIHPHPLVAFLMLNENLHLEHHLFPEVPSYHLPALHRLLRPRYPRSLEATSYFGVLWEFLRATPRLDETPVGRKEATRTVK